MGVMELLNVKIITGLPAHGKKYASQKIEFHVLNLDVLMHIRNVILVAMDTVPASHTNIDLCN